MRQRRCAEPASPSFRRRRARSATASEHAPLRCAGHVLSRPAPAPGAALNGRHYHIHTFGCQMNLADSERMAGVLESLGYACAEEANDADVLIYNTCSIREKAENKLYSALGKQVSLVIVARD